MYKSASGKNRKMPATWAIERNHFAQACKLVFRLPKTFAAYKPCISEVPNETQRKNDTLITIKIYKITIYMDLFDMLSWQCSSLLCRLKDWTGA